MKLAQTSVAKSRPSVPVRANFYVHYYIFSNSKCWFGGSQGSSVIFVLIYFLVLVFVFVLRLFFSFSFFLVFIIFSFSL